MLYCGAAEVGTWGCGSGAGVAAGVLWVCLTIWAIDCNIEATFEFVAPLL
jgi:hypothetical protein